MSGRGCYARQVARLSFRRQCSIAPRNAREGDFVPDDFKGISRTPRQQREHRQDLLTTTVRGIVQQAKTAQDAKTAKLKALRLARDADSPPAVEEAPKRARRKVTTDSGS